MKIIKGGILKKEEKREKMRELYENAFFSNYFLYCDVKKSIYYGVRALRYTKPNMKQDIQKLDSLLSYSTLVEKNISLITFNDFIEIFPITKNYKDGKYGMKDYYSTIEWLNQFDLNSKIGNNVDELLNNYCNEDIIDFCVKRYLIVDKIRRLNGQMGLLEEFFELNNMDIDTYFFDKKTNKMINKQTGETIEIINKHNEFKKGFKIVKQD